MKRIWNACLSSLAGFCFAWKDETAFRQEIILTAFLLPTAAALAADGIHLALLVLPVFLVLIAELLNTAIEAAVDRTGKDIHPLAKKAKDTASAAVFVALITLVAVWAAVLL